MRRNKQLSVYGRAIQFVVHEKSDFSTPPQHLFTRQPPPPSPFTPPTMPDGCFPSNVDVRKEVNERVRYRLSLPRCPNVLYSGTGCPCHADPTCCTQVKAVPSTLSQRAVFGYRLSLFHAVPTCCAQLQAVPSTLS